MTRRLNGWLIVGLLVGTTIYALAEDITLTTSYPSPRGVYQELRSTANTFLATDSGQVGIGPGFDEATLQEVFRTSSNIIAVDAGASRHIDNI